MKKFLFLVLVILFVCGCQRNEKSILSMDLNKDNVNEYIVIQKIGNSMCKLIIKNEKDGEILKEIPFYRPNAILSKRDENSFNVIFTKNSGDSVVVVYENGDYKPIYSEE